MINKYLQKSIVLFGGTFDPIHLGHINMAKRVNELISPAGIIFIPTGNSYLKNNVTDAQIRYSMVSKAIEPYRNFKISDIEVQSSEPSYTYKTIEYFKQKYQDFKLYFLIGEDSLLYIDKWKHPEILFENAELLVARRNNNNSDIIFRKKETLLNSYNGEITIFDYDMPISSTEIRNAYKSGTIEPYKEYIIPDVNSIIIEKKLYK